MFRKTAYVAAAAAALIGLSAAVKAETGTKEPSMAGAHDGFYLGITAGTNAADLKAEGLPSLADTSYFGGAYLGAGAVIGGFYYGAEIDAMLRDVRPGINDGTSSVTFSNKWMGSLRGRVGLPIGPALFYGTAGMAAQNATLKLDEPGLSSHDSQYLYGFVYGAGLEAKLTNTVGVRVEVLQYSWQDKTFELDGIKAELSQTDTVARVGVSFKLN